MHLVENFGSLVDLPQVQWSTPAIVLLTSLISLLVHCWYCHRVWMLTSFLQLSLSRTVAEFQSKQWISYIAVAFVTTADVYIAVTLCYFLKKHRHGVMPQTYLFVNTLLVYTVSSGLLTSVVALAYVFLSLLLPQTYIWWAVYFVLGEGE